MRETERLKLTKWQLFWHYSIVPFLLLIPVMNAYSIFQIKVTGTYTGVRTAQEHFEVGWPWIIPAIIFTIIQYQRLNFKKINRKTDVDEFKEAVTKAGEEMKWNITNLTKDYAIAITGFNWASWGERITIVRKPNEILINSICDPDNRPSVSSWGQNRKNIETFKKYIKPVPNNE